MIRFLPFVLLPALLGAQTIRTARMKHDLEILSSREMNGRVALEPGAERAASFIAEEFHKIGLSVQMQEFNLVAPVLDKAASKLTFRGGELPFNGSHSKDIAVSGGVVFAGYGITAPEYNYDDYRDLDANGKIVVIFDREPQEADPKSVFMGTGLTKHAAPRAKRLNAQLHGAAAVLVIPSPKSTAASGASNRTPMRGNAPAMFDELARIPMVTLTASAAEKIFPGYRAVQELIDATGRPASRALDGESALKLVHSSLRAGKTWNVIATLEGSDPKFKKSYVLLTSHYDHLPARGESYYPGANDNGSGTVSVIELARAFAAAKHRPKRSLVFISFGAEEEGLLGSYYYVAHPLYSLGDTKAVINLDMIGRNEAHTPQTEGHVQIAADTRNRLNVVGGAYFPELRKAVERANEKTGLTLEDKFDHDSTQNTLWRCDHFPFLLARVPTIWFFGGWHPGYHEPVDTVDLIDWRKMEKVVRLAYLTTEQMAR